MIDYLSLEDEKLSKLIENRWSASETLWGEIKKITKNNADVYDGKGKWLEKIPRSKPRVTANRVFTNTESVINSLIANPPRPNVLGTRDTEQAKTLARLIEKQLGVKYDLLNTKEVFRQGLRDLYFSRLVVLKPFWDVATNDIGIRRVDPNKVRFSKSAKNELESEFAIEEIDCTLLELTERYPDKKEAILKEAAVREEDLLIKNPEATYKECWIGDILAIKYKSLILSKVKNPYWDWDGVPLSQDELLVKGSDNFRNTLKDLSKKQASEMYKDVEEDGPVFDYRRKEEGGDYQGYLYNYFDVPRKPYIFATVLNNENKPIGRSSFIEQASTLQESVDRRKFQIDLNAEMVNGVTYVDSDTMDKGAAQSLRYETQAVIYGKNVLNGVKREFGAGLPAFIFEDMQDSRDEIDNIMAASSAFRGEREGQETKAGRLALIEQSFLRLNELVQVVDYLAQETFAWWTQLMKARYTEEHEIKYLGAEDKLEIQSITRDDIEDGVEIRVIPGKTLPQDRQFMYERAQADIQAGLLSPLDYFEEAGYANPKEKAKNAFIYQTNPAEALGIQVSVPEGNPQMPVPSPAVA